VRARTSFWRRRAIDAWFYPGESAAARPCIVIGHGFAAVKEARLDAFAERFAAAGFACLVFDYRHFGGSGGMPRQVIDIGEQRRTGQRARYARSLDRVDTERIGIWGTSFGGGLALEVAAKDAGVRAAVLQVPLVDSLAAGRYEGIGHTARIVLYGIRDLLHGLLRREPYLVPVVGPPGSNAFMVTPEAEPGYFSIVRSAPSWRNEVAPRVIFRWGGSAWRATPARALPRAVHRRERTPSRRRMPRWPAAKVRDVRVLKLPVGTSTRTWASRSA
jgi:pimeloyl-ACP methyl ester carboxylesterase